MPSDVVAAPEMWRALAREARACAAEMTDAAARRIMQEIAAGYDLLAERAEAQQARPPSP
jgi:hypothetical protein